MGAVMALYITIILYNFSFVKEISKFEPLNGRPILIAEREGEAQGKIFAFSKTIQKYHQNGKKCRPVCVFWGFTRQNREPKKPLHKRINQYFTNIIDKK